MAPEWAPQSRLVLGADALGRVVASTTRHHHLLYACNCHTPVIACACIGPVGDAWWSRPFVILNLLRDSDRDACVEWRPAELSFARFRSLDGMIT